MRFALSTLLGLALCLPAMAQSSRGPDVPGRGPGGPRGGEPPASKEIEELKATIKALEAKLKAVNEKKEGKVEVVVVKEEKKEERKPEPRRAEGERQPERDRRPEGGDRRPEGPPMGGRFGGGPGGFGPPMGGGGFGHGMGGGQPGTPPGFDKLTEDEKKTFRRLMEKMHATETREVPRTREVVREVPVREGSNVNERLDRLEKAVEDIRRMLQGQRGGPQGPREERGERK